MKKHFFLYPVLLILLFSLAACGDDTSLTEGSCSGLIAFTEIPKEFSLLDEHFMDQFYIHVRLENMTTEKYYDVTLNQENNFRQEVSLHPGTYRVAGAYANQIGSLGIQVEASAATLAFGPDHQAILTVTVVEPEKLTQRWMEIQPMPEILLADKYSGLIQINRKVIPIRDILSELHIENGDVSTSLGGFDKITLTDREKGVQVHLVNTTESPLPWSSCTVTGITVSNSSVLFPDGVSTDFQTEKVCHQRTGLYGEPTRFTGTLLYGWGVAESSAVYSDPISGNRITLNIDSNGFCIRSITYELAVFE